MMSVCDMRLYHELPMATPSIWGNPTVKCVNGNVGVLSSQDNEEKSDSPVQIDCQDKNAMKSVMRIIIRVVTRNKRNRIDALKPKGTESDYNGCIHIIGNGQTILGLEMASKAFKLFVIWNLVNLIRSQILGRSFARSDNSEAGRGYGKKQMSIYNGLNRGSKFALTRKGADLPLGVLLYEWRQTYECK